MRRLSDQNPGLTELESDISEHQEDLKTHGRRSQAEQVDKLTEISKEVVRMAPILIREVIVSYMDGMAMSNRVCHKIKK